MDKKINLQKMLEDYLIIWLYQFGCNSPSGGLIVSLSESNH